MHHQASWQNTARKFRALSRADAAICRQRRPSLPRHRGQGEVGISLRDIGENIFLSLFLFCPVGEQSLTEAGQEVNEARAFKSARMGVQEVQDSVQKRVQGAHGCLLRSMAANP